MIFPLAVSSPNIVYLAHESEQPTAGYIAIFHKYCCYIKHGGITTNFSWWIPWGYVTDMSKCHCVEHGLTYDTFYFKKHIAPLVVCSGSTLVRDGTLGAPLFVRLAYCGAHDRCSIIGPVKIINRISWVSSIFYDFMTMKHTLDIWLDIATNKYFRCR